MAITRANVLSSGSKEITHRKKRVNGEGSGVDMTQG